MNLYAYVGGNPVNGVDPEGLAGLNYDPNWRGRPEGWKPNGPAPSPKNILPENYKPNGINNLPGQKIPISENVSNGAKTLNSVFNVLVQLIKILGSGEAGMLMLVPLPPEAYTPGNCIPNDCAYDPVSNPCGRV